MRFPFVAVADENTSSLPDGDVVMLPAEALAPPQSLADRVVTYLRAHWLPRYQPDRFYMRGRGPAWHASHPPDWAPPRRH